MKKKASPAAPGEVAVGPVTRALLLSRARIQGPGKHTRGAFARDAKGHSVAPNDPSAACWCASGALTRTFFPPDTHDPKRRVFIFTNHPLHFKANQLLARAAQVIMQRDLDRKDSNSVTVVNDSLGREGALKMFNLAIKFAEGK